MPDDLDRLTLLERAQQLHDAVLRRHGEMLTWHEAAIQRHEAFMQESARRLRFLEDLLAQQTLTHRALLERMDHLDTTLVAIKDLLERWQNGR